MTGDYEKIYQRFLERNASPDRHRGHVVNDSYPESKTNSTGKTISYDNKKYTQENDLNKLDSLVTRLSLNGLTREEYYELRDLMSKYKNQINEQESINYEKIIDENQSKIR